jgi:hypothetical protein
MGRELDGGMTWKAVNGAEYLCRYRPDPETGKKKFTSLGRRSPATEATYHAFINRREAARQTVLSSRDDIALSGRVAKAHGLARLPVKSADVLRAFWHRSIDDQLTLFGGSALFAYELETEILAPAALTRDARLQFMFDGSSEFIMIDDILDAYEAAARRQGPRHPQEEPDHRRGRRRHPDRAPEQRLRDRSHRRRRPGRDAARSIQDAARQRPHGGPRRAAGRAQDLRPPRTYAMMAYVLGKDDDIWAERALFAGTLCASGGLTSSIRARKPPSRSCAWIRTNRHQGSTGHSRRRIRSLDSTTSLTH